MVMMQVNSFHITGVRFEVSGQTDHLTSTENILQLVSATQNG